MVLPLLTLTSLSLFLLFGQNPVMTVFSDQYCSILESIVFILRKELSSDNLKYLQNMVL